jgi:hypothetical protein
VLTFQATETVFIWIRTQNTLRICGLSSCNLAVARRRSLVLRFRAADTIHVRTRTQDIFRCCSLCTCNVLAESNNFGPGPVILASELRKPSSVIELRTVLGVCYLSLLYFLFEAHNICLCAVVLSCFVFELQKIFSRGIEPRTIFWGSGLCLCDRLFEVNNFDFGSVLLSCLVSELQEPASPGIELKTPFREF